MSSVGVRVDVEPYWIALRVVVALPYRSDGTNVRESPMVKNHWAARFVVDPVLAMDEMVERILLYLPEVAAETVFSAEPMTASGRTACHSTVAMLQPMHTSGCSIHVGAEANHNYIGLRVCHELRMLSKICLR